MGLLKKKVAKDGAPELMTVMMKVVERLDALEKKADQILSQMPARSFERQEPSKPAPQSFIPPPQTFKKLETFQRPNEVKPAPSQPQIQAPGNVQGRGRERRERMLHKAVCAECRKDCEIPFKPTGERPVYCKECFSKRKSGNSFKGTPAINPVPNLPTPPPAVKPPERHVVVTKKGVGKVTVSEIVRPSAQESSHRSKSHKPAKKSKRS